MTALVSTAVGASGRFDSGAIGGGNGGSVLVGLGGAGVGSAGTITTLTNSGAIIGGNGGNSGKGLGGGAGGAGVSKSGAIDWNANQ